MKKHLLFFLIVLTIFSVSCTKNSNTPNYTNGQLMAIKLSADISIPINTSSTDYSIYVWSQSPAFLITSWGTGTTLKVTSDGFITIASLGLYSTPVTYNLSLLKSYQLTSNQLNLYY